MNIVNLIRIGDEVRNMADLSQKERQEIALQLSVQALKPLGYVLEGNVKNKEETA